MHQTIRQSWPARLSAIGFIIVILAGNGWLVYALMGDPVPPVVSYAFAGGVFLALAGGLGLVLLTLKLRMAPPQLPENEE